MVCPQCGENLHRSRSRNFRESAIKSVTPYKTYRCSDCGWRGMIVPPKSTSDKISWRIRLVWIVGVVTALLIGLYTARLLAF
jgi:hypothetical protein